MTPQSQPGPRPTASDMAAYRTAQALVASRREVCELRSELELREAEVAVLTSHEQRNDGRDTRSLNAVRLAWNSWHMAEDNDPARARRALREIGCALGQPF